MRYECRRDHQLCLPARSGSSSPLPQRMTQPGSSLLPQTAGPGQVEGVGQEGRLREVTLPPWWTHPLPPPLGSQGASQAELKLGREQTSRNRPQGLMLTLHAHTPCPAPPPSLGKSSEACFLLPPPLPYPLPHAPQASPHLELKGPQPRGGV